MRCRSRRLSGLFVGRRIIGVWVLILVVRWWCRLSLRWLLVTCLGCRLLRVSGAGRVMSLSILVLLVPLRRRFVL